MRMMMMMMNDCMFEYSADYDHEPQVIQRYMYVYAADTYVCKRYRDVEIRVGSCILCAVVASSKAGVEPQSARRLGKASLVLSVIGLIIGIIIYVVVIILFFVAGSYVI